MLTITPTTDNPPATMVISIGSDSGLSDTGAGGTARGMIWGGAGAADVCAGRTSSVCSLAGAGTLKPGLAVEVGSGQRVAATGATTFASFGAAGWFVAAGVVGGVGKGERCACSGLLSGSTGVRENSARASVSACVAGGFLRAGAGAGSSTAAAVSSGALRADFSLSPFKYQH